MGVGDRFIPEVDGLRFLAILMVVLCHVSSILQEWSSARPVSLEGLDQVIASGFQGVQLFFGISGYILSIPFATGRIKKIDGPYLKQYYLRRVIRLELPYFLVLSFSAVVLVWGLHKYTPDVLWPHFLASMGYLHTWIWPCQQVLALPIAWTLEIEFAFYLVFPLMAMLFFLARKNRRLLLGLVLLGSPLLYRFYPGLCYTSLLYQLPYFIAGMLAADCRTDSSVIQVLQQMPARVGQLAIAFLIGMILLRVYSPQLGQVPMSWIVFLLLALVLLTDHGKAVFRNPLLFTIGGMCYSLYLVHSAVISALARIVVPLVETWTYWHQFLVFALLALVAVGWAGTVFYLLVEKTAQKWRLHIKY